MTTALLRKIADQDEAERQEAWEERKAANDGARVRRTKWAVDHLLDVGQITPPQHDAAVRYAEAYAAAVRPAPLGGSQLLSVHPAWDQTFGREMTRVMNGWNAEASRAIVLAARAWVQAAPRTNKARMSLMQRLFALPAPSWQIIRIRDANHMHDRVSSLLDVLRAFWDAQDEGYGPLDKTYALNDHLRHDEFARPG